MKRNSSPSHIARLGVLAAALVILFSTVRPLHARMVEVRWFPEDEQAEVRTRDDARAVGFKLAVHQEALDLLPGALSEARSNLLYTYLAPKAFEYVLSYSEAAAKSGAAPAPAAVPATGDAPAAEGAGTPSLTPGAAAAPAAAPRVLRMEVAVNRTALKTVLKRAGVYFTVSASQPYDLSLLGAAAGAWDEIGKLQTLSGLAVRSGVEPLLEINAVMTEPSEKEQKDGLKQAALMWSGKLTAEGRTWSAENRSLDEVWFSLWGGFFTRPGAEAGTVERLPLAVSGWYAPDGVQAFDKELAAWDDVVESAQLREVFMLPDGIAAVWSVRTLDRARLRQKLEQSLPGRGLAWDFSDQPERRE